MNVEMKSPLLWGPLAASPPKSFQKRVLQENPTPFPNEGWRFAWGKPRAHCVVQEFDRKQI